MQNRTEQNSWWQVKDASCVKTRRVLFPAAFLIIVVYSPNRVQIIHIWNFSPSENAAWVQVLILFPAKHKVWIRILEFCKGSRWKVSLWHAVVLNHTWSLTHAVCKHVGRYRHDSSAGRSTHHIWTSSCGGHLWMRSDIMFKVLWSSDPSQPSSSSSIRSEHC